MFKIIAVVLFAVQIIVMGSALIWLAGKIGFKPAQPYAAQVESTFYNLKSRF